MNSESKVIIHGRECAKEHKKARLNNAFGVVEVVLILVVIFTIYKGCK